MDLKELSVKLTQREYITPGELSEIVMELGGWYGLYASYLDEIFKKKPKAWLEIRAQEGVKSDAKADRLWELTEDGQKELLYRLRLKTIEKISSSIKSRLRVMSEEMRNLT